MNPVTTTVPCLNCGCGPATCYRLWEITLNCATGQFGQMTDVQQVTCTTPASLNWTLFSQTANTCKMRRWHPDGQGPPPLPTQAQIYSLCSCSNCLADLFGALITISGIPAIECHSALAESTFGISSRDTRRTTSPNGTYFSPYVPFTQSFLFAETNGTATDYLYNPNLGPLPNPGAPVSCENFNEVLNRVLQVFVPNPQGRPTVDEVFRGGDAPVSVTLDRCGRIKTQLWDNLYPPGGQVLVTLLYPGDLA